MSKPLKINQTMCTNLEKALVFCIRVQQSKMEGTSNELDSVIRAFREIAKHAEKAADSMESDLGIHRV
jgi:Asp/Glu/hydantoin racemase